MNSTEKILEILKKVKPTKDLSGITNIIEGGYLDSFELLGLISYLTDEFNISIEIDEMVPENFNSVEAIAQMVDRLSGKGERE